jgi:hypothetical protein
LGLRTSSSISSSLCHLFYISSQAFGCQLRTRLSLLTSSGWILCWHLWGGVCSWLKTQFHWSLSQLNFLSRLVPVTPNSAASHDSFPFLRSESESLRRINCPFLLQKFLCYYVFLIGWFCTMLEICLLSQQKNFDTEACKKRRISSWHCATLLYQPVRYRECSTSRMNLTVSQAICVILRSTFKGESHCRSLQLYCIPISSSSWKWL